MINRTGIVFLLSITLVLTESVAGASLQTSPQKAPASMGGPLQGPGGPAVRMLSLQDCIDMALTNSTAVLKGNNNVALAGTQVLAAYGQYLPNLIAGAGYNYDRGNNFYSSAGPELINENRSQFNYQLTSSINIFSGYYNYSNWKAAKLNKDISNLTLDFAKQQIELDITQSYLQVLLDRKIV